MSEPLRAFMVRLATDPERLAAFIDDADAAMADAGLSAEERELVRSGDQDRLYEALADRRGTPRPARPTGAAEPPTPAGTILVPVASPFGAAVVPVSWSPAGPTAESGDGGPRVR